MYCHRPNFTVQKLGRPSGNWCLFAFSASGGNVGTTNYQERLWHDLTDRLRVFAGVGNAILLVDYINQLRNAGLDRTEAILNTGLVRLRPIIMTTASTILGMLPIALGFGAGSELRSPMAVAIAGGLVTSTLLSLIVVPVVYTILDDWFPRFKNRGTA